MTRLPGPSFPRQSSGVCLDCDVVFNLVEGACPKCASTIGIVPVGIVHSSRVATKIAEQRELLDLSEGILKTVAIRIRIGLYSSVTARAAERMADRLREYREKERPPVSASGPERKESVR